MLNRLALVVSLALWCSIQSIPPACGDPPLPGADECKFYADCLEASVPCGVDGYALGYGGPYCESFSSAEMGQCMDTVGNAWVNSTLVCLQQKLVPILTANPQPDCNAITQMAFDSHPVCYAGGGDAVPAEPSLCFLPIKDVQCVLGTVDKKDIVSPQGLKEEARLAAICMEQLSHRGVCGTGQESVVEKDLCDFWDRLANGEV